jgi:predicted DsbA family dithiol-disulfide isomerase
VDDGDPIQVEIWSDLICPWCYLGKRRFEHALARFPGRDRVDVRWRSFELEPRSPVEPVDLAAGLVTRFGMSADEAVERNRHVTELAAADGLAYRLDIARLGNTFDAHHITHLAQAEGLQGDAVERLFAACFCEGRAICSRRRCGRTSGRPRSWGSARCRSSSSTAATRLPGRSRRSSSCRGWSGRSPIARTL